MTTPMTKSAVLLLLTLLALCVMAAHASGEAESPDQHMETHKRLYYQAVLQHVSDNWSYKKTLDNQFYSIQGSLVLDRRGTVLGHSISRGSADEQFNEEAVNRLMAIQPYPPIPETIPDPTIAVPFLLMPNTP